MNLRTLLKRGDSDGPADTAPEGAGASRSQVALAAAGLLVLLVLLWFFFLRGGGDDTETSLPPPPPAPVTTAPPSPGPAEEPPLRKKGKGPVETFEVFAPKDPFKPLITEGAGGATTGGETTAPGETPADGTAGGDGEPGTGGEGDAAGPGSSESVEGHTVKLVTTLRTGQGSAAQVQVDETVYRVQEGERFAESFKLVSISGDCAALLFGDDQFTLCEGEEILK